MIKKFENFIETPKIGDYVLIHFENSQRQYYEDEKFINFINTTIGKITGIWKDQVYLIFNVVPEKYKKYFVTSNFDDSHNIINFYIDQILVFGTTPEEVKIKAEANKYNL